MAISKNAKRNLNALEEIKKETGCANVNSNTIHSDGSKVGPWLRYLRAKKRSGKIDPELEAALSKLGVDLHTSYVESRNVKKNLKALEEIKKETGCANVHSLTVHSDGSQVGAWLNYLRAKKRAGKSKIDPKLEEALSKLGVDLTTSYGSTSCEKTWESKLVLLKTELEKVDLVKISREYKTPCGTAIGVWLSRQRSIYLKGRLSQNRIDQLKEVGVDVTQTLLPTIFNWTDDDKTWRANLKKITAIFPGDRINHIPNNFIDESGFAVEKWMKEQTQNYRTGSLCPRRLALLRKAGFGFYKSKAEQEEKYKAAADAIEKHGLTKIWSTDYPTGSELSKIARWIKQQVRFLHEKETSDEKIKELSAIGLTLDNFAELQHGKYIAALEELKNQGASTNVCSSFVTKEGLRLGRWIVNARRLNTLGYLPKYTKTKLELLGVSLARNPSKYRSLC